MVLCCFYRSHREICTRNWPLSETIFLDDFWGPFLSRPLCFTADATWVHRGRRNTAANADANSDTPRKFTSVLILCHQILKRKFANEALRINALAIANGFANDMATAAQIPCDGRLWQNSLFRMRWLGALRLEPLPIKNVTYPAPQKHYIHINILGEFILGSLHFW